MVVAPVGRGGFPCAGPGVDLTIVVLGVAIKGTVAYIPRTCTVKLVASGSRQKLNLSIASSHFDIHGSDDQSRFRNEIRTHVSGREGIGSPSRTACRVNSIALKVHSSLRRQTREAAADSV